MTNQKETSAAFCDLTKGTDFNHHVAERKGGTDFLFYSERLRNNTLKTFTMQT